MQGGCKGDERQVQSGYMGRLGVQGRCRGEAGELRTIRYATRQLKHVANQCTITIIINVHVMFPGERTRQLKHVAEIEAERRAQRDFESGRHLFQTALGTRYSALGTRYSPKGDNKTGCRSVRTP